MPRDSTLAEPPPPAFSHAEILRVIFGVTVCIFLAALDQTVVIPALPAIASDLGAYQQLSWIVAAYLITTTVSTPIYGKLSDLYGRRRLLVVCISIFIVTSLLCGAARSLDQLIWFRALQGLGGGGLMALTQAAIADVVSPRERGRYQGYISAVWAITSLTGPIVGGFLAEHLSWRWIFWINLPLGGLALWICHTALRRLPPPVLRGRPRLDILGMLLLSGAITVLLLALGWGGNAYAWGSPEILGLAGAGALLLTLLVVQELRSTDPLLPPRVFRSGSYVANLAISTNASFLMFMCLFTIPLHFQLARGATAAQAGMVLVPFMLASAAGNVAGSRWARHFGAVRNGLRLAAGLKLSGLLLLAVLPLDAPIWAIVAGMVIAGLGVGSSLIGSITGAQNALVTKDIGSGTGAVLVMRSVGGACGSTLAGAIVAAGLLAAQRMTGGSVHLPGGAFHHGAPSLDTVVAKGSAAASAALGGTFGMTYAVAAAVAAVSLAVALFMPNAPLRTTVHQAPPPE